MPLILSIFYILFYIPSWDDAFGGHEKREYFLTKIFKGDFL